MAHLNLYVRASDEPAFEKFKKILEKENLAMSEVIADMVSDYVEAKATELGDIELEGLGPRRIFKGRELYWQADGDSETGVFLTAKGAIAYWRLVPRAINEEEQETFEVYADLEELWENQDWIKPRVRSAIQREYGALTNKPMVERLDI